MDESDYVELRCRSAFSFLEGASNPEDLAARAAELGHGALALADRAGVYGLPRFHTAARAAGVRAICGAVVALEREGRSLLLLVESPAGYRNLCRLLTLGQARAPKGECLARWDDVEAHAGGLVALARGDGGLGLAHLDRAKAAFPGRL
jgi:error-prone DNA polymerase